MSNLQNNKCVVFVCTIITAVFAIISVIDWIIFGANIVLGKDSVLMTAVNNLFYTVFLYNSVLSSMHCVIDLIVKGAHFVTGFDSDNTIRPFVCIWTIAGFEMLVKRVVRRMNVTCYFNVNKIILQLLFRVLVLIIMKLRMENTVTSTIIYTYVMMQDTVVMHYFERRSEIVPSLMMKAKTVIAFMVSVLANHASIVDFAIALVK